jgi:lipopolysaccharide biosynthesis glycosyltransferase
MDRITLKNIPVVFAANDDFAAPLAAALYSLKRSSHSVLDIRILYISGRLNSDNRRKLCFATDDTFSVSFMEIFPCQLPVHPNPRISMETYLRFLLPEVLSEYDQAIYLDCDILVFSDLAELACMPMTEPVSAVVNDEAEVGYCDDILGFNKGEYFNTGIMIMDLNAFRAQNISEKCISYLTTHPDAKYQDEEALNVVLRGHWCRLPLKWNLQWKLHELKKLENAPDAENFAFSNEGILHYAGNEKPWEFTDREYASYFTEIIAHTPYQSIMEQPLFSIIVTAQCGVNLLTDCLKSVLRSTLYDIEIIYQMTIHDSDTDTIAEKMAAKDSRLRLLYPKEHAINLLELKKEAVQAARGRYVLFLNACDTLEPYACEVLYEEMQREYTDILAFDVKIETKENIPYNILCNKKNLLAPFPMQVYGESITKMVTLGILGTELWNKCYRTAPVKKGFFELKKDTEIEDWEWTLFLAIAKNAYLYRSIRALPMCRCHFCYEEADRPSNH